MFLMLALDLITCSGFSCTQVCLSKEGTVAEYGMLAKDDIEEGETLFFIPRRAVLSQSTTKVKTVLEEGKVERSAHTEMYFHVLFWITLRWGGTVVSPLPPVQPVSSGFPSGTLVSFRDMQLGYMTYLNWP